MWNIHGRQDRAGLLMSRDSSSGPSGKQLWSNGGASLMNAALSSAELASCCPAVLLSISFCFGQPLPANAQALSAGPVSTLSGIARVIDGDTLEVEKERVRLFGVDAPESAQTCTDKKGASYGCGKEATEALRSKIGNSPVKCLVRNHDQYQRAVATCQIGSEDVAKWMVQQGERWLTENTQVLMWRTRTTQGKLLGAFGAAHSRLPRTGGSNTMQLSPAMMLAHRTPGPARPQ